jgi:thioredoxin-like negative regulator of GroEL
MVNTLNPGQQKFPIQQVGEADFETKVLKSALPVLVVFEASWSHPCHVMDTVLEDVVAATVGILNVVRIDADDNPDLSLWHGIQQIPTLLMFVHGEQMGKIIGTVSKEAILARLKLISGGKTSPPTLP